MHGDISPLSQYAFIAWCSVKAQGQYPVERRLGEPRDDLYAVSLAEYGRGTVMRQVTSRLLIFNQVIE